MFFADKDGIILHCPKHKFIKFRFKRKGKPILFDDIQVTGSEMPKGIHFDHEPLPIFAYGKFELKNGKRNNKT